MFDCIVWFDFGAIIAIQSGNSITKIGNREEKVRPPKKNGFSIVVGKEEDGEWNFNDCKREDERERVTRRIGSDRSHAKKFFLLK